LLIIFLLLKATKIIEERGSSKELVRKMIDAVKNGGYDKHKIALVITQTGGGCRASNYIFLLRKALAKAEMEYIPVVSLSFGLEKNPGFKFTPNMILQAVAAIEYGDIIALLGNQTRPYEINKGETNTLINKWTHKPTKVFFTTTTISLHL
jgi:predicted nucleotide-binding protein (sugar kinase/HSP70/actin superfamily)